MNTLVSFQLAKLLKEREFDKRAEKRYGTKSGILYNDAVINDLEDDVFTAAPTIAEVVMWLYEKHGIWISSEPFIKNDNSVVNIYKIFKEGIIDTISRGSLGYASPTEAYEAAIEYTLKNLISDGKIRVNQNH